MATITETQRTGKLGYVILLLALAALMGFLLVSLSVPDVGSVETRPHAVERHGGDAELVRREIAAGGGTHYRCNNGKEYIVKDLGGGRWALMVIRNGMEITSFIADRRYVIGRLRDDGCSNGWSHP